MGPATDPGCPGGRSTGLPVGPVALAVTAVRSLAKDRCQLNRAPIRVRNHPGQTVRLARFRPHPEGVGRLTVVRDRVVSRRLARPDGVT